MSKKESALHICRVILSRRNPIRIKHHNTANNTQAADDVEESGLLERAENFLNSVQNGNHPKNCKLYSTHATHIKKKSSIDHNKKYFFVSFRFGFYGNIFYDTFDIHQECEIIYESLRYHIIVLVHIEMNIELLKLCEDHTLNPSVYRYILFSREIAIC